MQCVKCSLHIVDELYYVVGEMGPELTETIESQLGNMVSDQDVFCGQCFEYFIQLLSTNQFQSNETEDSSIEPTRANQCVWCQCSLNRTRRHALPEGSERDLIVSRIFPREIPLDGQVCYACWVAARRNVQRNINEEERAGSFHHENVMCVSCGTVQHRRRTHVFSERRRDDIASRIYPRQLPDHALMCLTC